jgi:tetratricopeptide (TPR) repeat protein
MQTNSWPSRYGLAYNADSHARERLKIKLWLDSAMRVFLAAVLFLSCGLVIAGAIADWFSAQGTPEDFRNAIRWAPWNARKYAGLARALERPLKAGNETEVVRLYEMAVRLSPQDAGYLARLGQADESAGRNQEATRAYGRALILAPNSAATNWVVGNFYLREGNLPRAMALFQKTILLDPDSRRPAFDLVWRATEDGELIANEMVPPQADI